jgi:D-serine deaminase-like pyridoxal phosphate-dependent protein
MADFMGKNTYTKNYWYRISNPGEVNSPALLVYPDRVESNIRKMISIAGNPIMLRPHVKTHKIPEIVRLQMKYGIRKFKCATIAEAEMTADCGAEDILLAYQPVGPNIRRFLALRKKFQGTKISCIADCEDIIKQLSENALKYDVETSVWLDINNGMNRTGIAPGELAAKLYKMIVDLPMIHAGGLHVYDGHIHEKEFSLRKKECDEAYLAVTSLLSELSLMVSLPVKVVAGGTPTFPIHAKRTGVETSPGTTLLWDYGYSSSFSDMDFLHAAVLFTRIISKPAGNLICIDLGHKAVASEMPQPRIKLAEVDNYEIISHNEEHMVIRTPEAERIKIGDVLYGIPYHICPTVDRFDKVSVVRDGRVTEQWKVEARTREITV